VTFDFVRIEHVHVDVDVDPVRDPGEPIELSSDGGRHRSDVGDRELPDARLVEQRLFERIVAPSALSAG